MLWHESRRARDDDYAATRSLTSHSTQTNLADVYRTDQIHVENTLRRLLELAMLVKFIVEVIAIFRYPAVDDDNVNLRVLAERGE